MSLSWALALQEYEHENESTWSQERKGLVSGEESPMLALAVALYIIHISYPKNVTSKFKKKRGRGGGGVGDVDNWDFYSPHTSKQRGG